VRRLKLSNGVEITAHVGDGFDGASGIFVRQGSDVLNKEGGQWGHAIPHKDLPKVIRLLAWYERAEMSLRHSEGRMWRHIAPYKYDYPALQDTDSPYQAAFYRGHLESHLRHCGCGKERSK
jgi:hypothetical protein